MGIKGVIFDFNGTLFWDTELHNRAWDMFLERHRIVLSDKEKDDRIHGKNNLDILSSLFPGDLSPNDRDRMSREKEDIYQDLCLQNGPGLAEGSTELFRFLKSNHIPFTIATAADLYNMEFYFRQLDLGQYFDLSGVIYSDGSTKSKPDPDLFIRALKVLGLEADEVLIFEDSISGIQAAENTRVKRIIIVNSTNSDYSCWDYQVIKDFSEVDRTLFT